MLNTKNNMDLDNKDVNMDDANKLKDTYQDVLNCR